MLVLFSGGADSTCLLHVTGARRALHVNHGLRPDADADEAHCRAVCASLDVELLVHRAGEPSGNVQDWARRERYDAAERLALPGEEIAAGHTATDQVETVLYRLAASPGRRALLGIPARRGRIVRPILHMSRADTRAYCQARGLPFLEDPSNDDPRYARNRVRHGLVEALRDIHPAAEANVLRTLEILRAEAEVIDDELARALRGEREWTPALERLRPPAPQDLPAPPDAHLGVPGELAWGGGVLRAEVGGFPIGDGTLDVGDAPLVVRSWRDGDRMRPLGMGGRSKSLQDLFTDRKVPRHTRRAIPVVWAGDEIAWIPGVATAEPFKVTEHTHETVRLAWST
jgi:tRNA(Ile)-lysidine synthase